MADSTVNFPGPLGSIPVKATDNLDGTYSLQVSTVGGNQTVQDLLVTGDLEHTGTLIGLNGATPTAQAANEPDLDDQTGGTPGDTLAEAVAVGAASAGSDTVDITDTASLADVNTALGVINDDIASISAKVNVILDYLKLRGDMVAD